MTDLVTIFRTRSDVEASIVRGLLEAHGVPSVVASPLPQSLFPMALIEQEVTTASYVDIPGEVLDVYRVWRPTPLVRARRL